MTKEKATRECPRWCDGDGHVGWLPGEDQVHASEERRIQLSLTQCVPGWNVHDAEVYAGLWQVHGEETAVLVVLDDRVEITLTLDEARQFAQHITDLCGEADAEGTSE
jgi:hypothetical protein